MDAQEQLTKPFGVLEEHEISPDSRVHQAISNELFRKKLLSEPPNFKLITFMGISYRVPIPWTHYYFIGVNKPRHRKWKLLSMYMSGKGLSESRLVTRPFVPNLYSRGIFFTPCIAMAHINRVDINRIISNFWDAPFNLDLAPNISPVSTIAQKARTADFSHKYFQYWEKMEIEEVLSLPWSETLRV